jgi:hypothetical protein
MMPPSLMLFLALESLLLGVVSRDLGLNRRERHQSYSNVAINDFTPNTGFLGKIVIVVILQEWHLPP